jgi:hypothetical protein
MVAALGTFALANGWSPPTPGAHRWWRICTNSTDFSSTGSYQLTLEWVDFKNNAGVSVGTPGTIIVSGAPSTAANAFVNDNTTWTPTVATSGEENYFIGGDWGSPVDVRRVTIRAPFDQAAPRLVSLEFSDDGINWSPLHCFHHVIYPVDTDQTYTWSSLTWPLSPDGEHYYGMGGDYSPTTNWVSYSDYIAANTASSIRACNFQITMGKSGLGFAGTALDTLLYPVGDTDIAEWHFFADTTVSKYINVAFKYQYKGEPRWSHWMMGEIDKKGLGHNGVCHLNVDNMYFFPNSDSSTSNLSVHFKWRCPFIPYNVYSAASDRVGSWRFKSGGAYPVPNDGAWPNRTDVHNNSRIAPTLLITPGANVWNSALQWGGASNGNTSWPGANGWGSEVNPVSGFVTLGTIPFIVNAGNDYDDLFSYLGEFADVRSVNIRSMAEGEEITVGTDTWKCFPRLRRLTSYVTQFQPGSGWAGWAYRKVV